ncbi:hypothetical protein FFLO_06327 [Filobasidium floriforme]|uniref:Uncharacterized protein n=1 Tax=Filobasidium floriforme TaxID=5210 RepID=A0A8K0NKN3_9TREE|nr:uncharacterized protein HD553DRAFT_324374 [Filobasidium floriforme]KAG7528212.1 hypothetical protein FFLO_06327 [Filobasidium floriforme]KAH8084272.1 hypothetical protein HD553DRAFT_324374 [Filobasidium floriforme]
MSSDQLNRLFSSLDIDPDEIARDANASTLEFDADSEHGQDDSDGGESALSSNIIAQPRKFAKSPGIMVKSPVGRGATLDAKRGKDDPKFTAEAYEYEEKCKGRSHFCFDTSDEIDIGIHETTGNKVVKIYKPTLKELEDRVRKLLEDDKYARVHPCIEKFLRVHIEEGEPLPVKLTNLCGGDSRNNRKIARYRFVTLNKVLMRSSKFHFAWPYFACKTGPRRKMILRDRVPDDMCTLADDRVEQQDHAESVKLCRQARLLTLADLGPDPRPATCETDPVVEDR